MWERAGGKTREGNRDRPASEQFSLWLYLSISCRLGLTYTMLEALPEVSCADRGCELTFSDSSVRVVTQSPQVSPSCRVEGGHGAVGNPCRMWPEWRSPAKQGNSMCLLNIFFINEDSRRKQKVLTMQTNQPNSKHRWGTSEIPLQGNLKHR